MIPSINLSSLTDALIKELERRGYSSKKVTKAKKILEDKESRKEIFEIAKIDKEKIEKATSIKNQIQTISNEIVILRYHINESSKILGKKLFEHNDEISKISTTLPKRQVTDYDSLHIFIDDLHKYTIQSAKWDILYKNEFIKPVLKMIEKYRNYFDHIPDMKDSGKGTENFIMI